MSMLATVQSAVEAAFSAAGDLVQTVTWRKQAMGAYDVPTGTRAVTNSDTPVRAIEDKVTQRDVDRFGLSMRAVKLFIPAADFTEDPAIADKLVHRGTLFTARSCNFAGAKALWEVLADV